jgi:hypothetical protein
LWDEVIRHLSGVLDTDNSVVSLGNQLRDTSRQVDVKRLAFSSIVLFAVVTLACGRPQMDGRGPSESAVENGSGGSGATGGSTANPGTGGSNAAGGSLGTGGSIAPDGSSDRRDASADGAGDDSGNSDTAPNSLVGAWSWEADILVFRADGGGTYYRNGRVCFELIYVVVGNVETQTADRDSGCEALRLNSYEFRFEGDYLILTHSISRYVSKWQPTTAP